jgi:DNA-binding response OmpR family regulator
VIEDEIDILDSIVDILEINGFVVKSSSDGYAGIDMVKYFKPDVILCDALSARVSGTQLNSNLK